MMLLDDPKGKIYGQRFFSYAAPHEWNKLPLNIIKESSSIYSFKSRLKTYLFGLTFFTMTNKLY